MKTLFAAAAAIAIASSASAASAQTLDISTIKCSDIDSMKGDEVVMVLAWIDGYLGGGSDDTRLDVGRFSANVDKAQKACAADPNAGLLSVIKAADSE